MSDLARLHLVTLGVADVARSTDFYEHLGWRRSSASQPEISFMRGHGVVLALWSRDSLAEDAGMAPGSTGVGGMALAVNLAGRADVDAAVARAQEAGASVAKPATDASWGGRSGYVRDPDGHLWEFAWNPHFPFADDGSLRLPE